MTIRTKLEKILFRTLRLPTCQELEQFAYDYLEGTLDAATARKVERHLKICAPCVQFVQAYRRVRFLTPLEEPPPLNPEFQKELLSFLKKQAV